MIWKVDKVCTGLLIKEKCVENGITPKQISEMFNVTLTVPYLWFSGETVPKIDHLVSLAKLFKCPIEDLLVVEHVVEQGEKDAD